MDKFDETFCWLHHYEHEFNESPYLQVNLSVNHLKKIFSNWKWAEKE